MAFHYLTTAHTSHAVICIYRSNKKREDMAEQVQQLEKDTVGLKDCSIRAQADVERAELELKKEEAGLRVVQKKADSLSISDHSTAKSAEGSFSGGGNVAASPSRSPADSRRTSSSSLLLFSPTKSPTRAEVNGSSATSLDTLEKKVAVLEEGLEEAKARRARAAREAAEQLQSERSILHVRAYVCTYEP